MRSSSFARATRETAITVELALDGGERRIDVPDGFLGHLLEAFATHAGLGLALSARGDTHVDLHHTVEDCGVALGEALARALGERRGSSASAKRSCRSTRRWRGRRWTCPDAAFSSGERRRRWSRLG